MLLVRDGRAHSNPGRAGAPDADDGEHLERLDLQAAPVSEPLGSVKRMCASGHRVIFDEVCFYNQNKTTGEINWLREESGNYMLDF